jgi:hypothetical protein
MRSTSGPFPAEPFGTGRLLAPAFVAGSPHTLQIFGRSGFAAEVKIRPVAARITSHTRSEMIKNVFAEALAGWYLSGLCDGYGKLLEVPFEITPIYVQAFRKAYGIDDDITTTYHFQL